jgi:endonuclease G
MKYLLSLVLAFSSTLAAASPTPLPMDQCKAEMPFGLPATNKTSVIDICHGAYVTRVSTIAKIPVLESYVLEPEHAVGCVERDSSFQADNAIQGGAVPKDYAKSGYDIGHLVNAADLEYSKDAQSVAAILSNAAPQLPGFNRGIWKRLETYTRAWAVQRNHPIQIVVGSVFSPADPYMKNTTVVVPHGFFKVLIDLKTNEVMPFYFPHEPSKNDMSKYLTSLADVQQKAGVIIPLPKGATISKTMWPLGKRSVVNQKQSVCSLN